MRKFKCAICGYVYDEAVGIPEKGIPPGTRWEDIPDDFTCPICTAPKSVFNQIEEAAPVNNDNADKLDSDSANKIENTGAEHTNSKELDRKSTRLNSSH